MNLKIFEETEREPLYLKLIKGKRDEILLIATDKDGQRKVMGNLLYFNNNGHLHLCDAINPELGFDLDSDGELIIV